METIRWPVLIARWRVGQARWCVFMPRCLVNFARWLVFLLRWFVAISARRVSLIRWPVAATRWPVEMTCGLAEFPHVRVEMARRLVTPPCVSVSGACFLVQISEARAWAKWEGATIEVESSPNRGDIVGIHGARLSGHSFLQIRSD